MIEVITKFTGYPDDIEREFNVGEIVDDLPVDYALMLIDKGLVVLVDDGNDEDEKG